MSLTIWYKMLSNNFEDWQIVFKINKSLFARSCLDIVTLYVAPVAVSAFHFNPMREEWTRHWAQESK